MNLFVYIVKIDRKFEYSIFDKYIIVYTICSNFIETNKRKRKEKKWFLVRLLHGGWLMKE